MESLNLQAFSSVRDAASSLQPGSQPKAFSIEAKGMHGCTHTYNVSMQQHHDGSIEVGVSRQKPSFFSSGDTSRALKSSISQYLAPETQRHIAIIQPRGASEEQATLTLKQKMDSLYQQHNITGYTQGGGLGQQPTVYFRSGDEYGHITQEHDDPTNVGREPPIKDPNYRFGNIGKGSGKHLFESSPRTGTYHHSRGAFIPVAQGSQKQSELGQAIVAHPQIKDRYQGDIGTLNVLAGIKRP